MAGPSRGGVPAAFLWKVTLTRVVPVGLVIGAAMETFMYYTGFWNVATRKEAERRAEAAAKAAAEAEAAALAKANPLPKRRDESTPTYLQPATPTEPLR